MSSRRGLAIITGAAGGLGLAFANKLAERGYRLLLIDRRQAQLDEVRAALARKHCAETEACALDLCDRKAVEQLAGQLVQRADIELLVNNAGFGTVDFFVDTDVNYLVSMVDVHVVAPTILTRAVLPGMIERNQGSVINVSSLAAWFRGAGNVQYGSTKNYLAVFAETLQDELRGTNVHVQALCPGFVRTDFHGAESMSAFKLRPAPAGHWWMTAEDVAEISLRRLSSNQVVVVPGFRYWLLGRFARMPFFQGLVQWITRAPRSRAATATVADT